MAFGKKSSAVKKHLIINVYDFGENLCGKRCTECRGTCLNTNGHDTGVRVTKHQCDNDSDHTWGGINND